MNKTLWQIVPRWQKKWVSRRSERIFDVGRMKIHFATFYFLLLFMMKWRKSEHVYGKHKSSAVTCCGYYDDNHIAFQIVELENFPFIVKSIITDIKLKISSVINLTWISYCKQFCSKKNTLSVNTRVKITLYKKIHKNIPKKYIQFQLK